jgi:hypothetical protein
MRLTLMNKGFNKNIYIKILFLIDRGEGGILVIVISIFFYIGLYIFI